MNAPRPHFKLGGINGFTLVELVVAITVGAIVVGVSVVLMTGPVDAYMAQARRSELVLDSDRISRWLLQDTQDNVLPNSVRILTTPTTRVLQLISTAGFAFYVPGNTAPEQLDFLGGGDNSFLAYGRFPNGLQPSWRLSINNVGTGPTDAYRTSSSTTATLGAAANNADPVQLIPPFLFPSGPSAWNRVYVIKEPVTYICDLSAGTLQRFNNHALAASVPANSSDAQLNTAGTVTRTLATGVTACVVSCPSAVGLCKSSVKFDLTLARGTSPQETIRVFQEIPVDNTP